MRIPYNYCLFAHYLIRERCVNELMDQMQYLHDYLIAYYHLQQYQYHL